MFRSWMDQWFELISLNEGFNNSLINEMIFPSDSLKNISSILINWLLCEVVSFAFIFISVEGILVETLVPWHILNFFLYSLKYHVNIYMLDEYVNRYISKYHGIVIWYQYCTMVTPRYLFCREYLGGKCCWNHIAVYWPCDHLHNETELETWFHCAC